MEGPWEQYAQQPQQATQPQQGPQWASDLSRKDQAEIKMRMYQEGRKRLADLQHDIANGGAVLNDLNEFGRLNRDNSTGSVWQQLTPDKQMFRTPGSMEMTAIQSRLAPAMRAPGSGSSSDRDVSLFLKSLPNTENYGNVNKGIREDFDRNYKLAIEKSNAMAAHLNEAGNLLGFDAQWAQRKTPTQPNVIGEPPTAPNQAHIRALKMSPNQAAAFDEKFGAGAAAKVLGR